MRERGARWPARVAGAARSTGALLAAATITLLLFLLLPWLQTMGRPPKEDVELRRVDAVIEAPPPPVSEPEPEPEPEKEPPPPELLENAPPLDLAQLEMALDLSGGGGGAGDFAVRLPGAAEQAAAAAGDADGLFSTGDLDSQPRVIFQPPPEYPAALRRKKIKGTVQVIFQVDKQGRVLNPVAREASHPAFEQPAVQAVKRWRFEPGKRAGKPVSVKMRIPISFTVR